MKYTTKQIFVNERKLILEDYDYEVFYQGFQQLEKNLKEKVQHTQRSFKKIIKDSKTGNVKQLTRDIEELRVLADELAALSNDLQNAADNYDSRGYFESGEFTRQLIEYCKQYEVDIKGEAGVYEMFPFKLRVDAENQDLYVNRRKVQCMRPAYFAQDMKQQVEKYMKSAFNMSYFIDELSEAYDLAVIVRNSKSPAPRFEFDVNLKDIYGYLAPTRKARREYDSQQYAYDLSRLYISGLDEQTKDGRRFQLGSSKIQSKLIRILDGDGKEQYLGTIRFFKMAEETPEEIPEILNG